MVRRGFLSGIELVVPMGLLEGKPPRHGLKRCVKDLNLLWSEVFPIDSEMLSDQGIVLFQSLTDADFTRPCCQQRRGHSSEGNDLLLARLP